MLNYYTTIILLSLAALLVLCVLVHENDRLKKAAKERLLSYLPIDRARFCRRMGRDTAQRQPKFSFLDYFGH